jgi:hypothetical protein
MKASDLVNLWGAPDNTRLTAKQASFRLPVHVAAKISALCEMYPNKTRTQIVGDLLATALIDVEKALPSYKGQPWHEQRDEEGKELFYAVGPAVDFREQTNYYYAELEKELGVEKPALFYDADLIWSE